jgi:hypothetical protein
MSDYISKEIALNTRFCGDYSLLRWILKKYKKQLPYNGEILRFAQDTLYSKDICHSWNYFGVQVRAWNCLHKDLIVAHLLGKIEDPKDLCELQREFESGDKI